MNLGIADEYALIWGNIKGNLINQEDLYNFVTSSIDTSIHNVLDSKADVYSPSFLESLQLRCRRHQTILLE